MNYSELVSKLRISLLIILVFYNINAYPVNCISKTSYIEFLLSISQKQAQIANIPDYKAAMLVNRRGNSKIISLIKAYKKAHMQEPLNDKQIALIEELEVRKSEFPRENICTN